MKISMLSILLFLSACAPKVVPDEPGSTTESEVTAVPSTPPEDAGLQERSFYYVWDRIGVSYPYEDMRGIDWNQAYWDHLPAAREAETAEALRPVLASLLEVLGESHFVVHPGAGYEAMNDVDSEAVQDRSGEVGLDVRLLEDRCLVVRVREDSTAKSAGLQPGDEILRVGDLEISSLLQELREGGIPEEMIPFVVRRKTLRATKGPPGSSTQLVWIGVDEVEDSAQVERRYRPAKRVQMGNLPNLEVIFEDRVLESESGLRIGYVYFNIFLGDIVTHFSEVMERFVAEELDGVILDLRGNPGGLGAMSRGIAGHFVFDSSQSLGMMKMRTSKLNFFVVPKVPDQRFEGPLVILLDNESGSTSEILAGGLQDLGRATIVGSTSAGMALPSVIERMPNGDAIQFAMGDLETASGYRIEGQGVRPDIEVILTAEGLAGGKDPVVQEALNWIEGSRDPMPKEP